MIEPDSRLSLLQKTLHRVVCRRRSAEVGDPRLTEPRLFLPRQAGHHLGRDRQPMPVRRQVGVGVEHGHARRFPLPRRPRVTEVFGEENGNNKYNKNLIQL